MAKKEVDLANVKKLTANNNISTNSKRSILQHCMFGVLFVLLVMNWDFYRVPSYEPFEKSLKTSNENIETQSANYKSALKEIKEEEGYQSQIEIDSLAIIFRERTKNLIEKVDGFSQSLKVSELKSITNSDLNKGDSILKEIEHYNLETFLLFGIDTTHSLFRNSLLNNQNLNSFHYLIGSAKLPFFYPTKLTSILALVSLKNNLIVFENIILEQLFYKAHEAVLNCRFYKALAFSNEYFKFVGEEINFQIGIGDFGFINGKDYLKSEISEGKLDDKTYRNEGLILWNSKGNQLGLNTVTGNVTEKFHKVEHNFPFSFSYFVAAPGAALQINKNNFCYLDMPNLMRIKVPGYAADKIKLRVAGAIVRKIEDAVFDIRFSKMPNGKVYAFVDATNAQGRTSTVHSIELKVIAPPPPITNLDAFKNEGIDISVFKNLQNIAAMPTDTDFEMDYELLSFEVECISSANKYTEPISCVGAAFATNPQLQFLLQNATSGDRFIFSHIKAKATNGKVYEALPISITLR